MKRSLESQLGDYFRHIDHAKPDVEVLDLMEPQTADRRTNVKRTWIWGSSAAAALVIGALVLVATRPSGEASAASQGEALAIATVDGVEHRITEFETCLIEAESFDIEGRGTAPDGSRFVVGGSMIRTEDYDNDGSLDADGSFTLEYFGPENDPVSSERPIYMLTVLEGVENPRSDFVASIEDERLTLAGLARQVDGNFLTTAEGVPITFSTTCAGG